MTQELRDDSKPDDHDQPSEYRKADPSAASGLEYGTPTKPAIQHLPESIKTLIAEVRRQLENRGGADSNYADQELYTERKLREAFFAMPHVKSVAYTRKCDDWTLVITHDDEVGRPDTLEPQTVRHLQGRSADAGLRDVDTARLGRGRQHPVWRKVRRGEVALDGQTTPPSRNCSRRA